jgi:hypothetical protein
MEPVMNEVDTRKGDIAIGATLVLAGIAVVLDRAGVFHWRDQWTLWPLILGGIGLARLLQSAPGEPKQGLLFLTAAAWLLLGETGRVSLEESWPIAVIALGLIVALNGGTRRRWRMPQPPQPPGGPADATQVGRRHRHRHGHNRTLSPLAVVGTWIAIVVALQVSGVRSFREANPSDGDRVRVVSVMARSEHISQATAFQGADVTNVMGRSELDLHNATMAPGANATVHVFSAMGAVVLRVPPTWTVETGSVTALGGVRDERFGVRDERDSPLERDDTVGPAPRLVLRGLVMFGRLTITS